MAVFGKYEPLISKETFDKCQVVRLERSKGQTIKKTRYPYLFRGFFKCAITKRQITCDLKKGRYHYLISTYPDDTSKRIYVRQEKVITHIEKKLRAIRLSDEQFLTLKEYVKQSLHVEKSEDQTAVTALNKEREGIEGQLDKLTDLLMNDSINQYAYDRKHAQLQQRYSEITVLLREKASEDSDKLEKALISLLLLCNKSLYLFKSSKTQFKRLLSKTLFTNFELRGSNVHCTIVTPLSLILKNRECTEWQGQ